MARITVIQGHPTPGGGHFGHALADAYADAAESAGHAVRRVTVADLDFPLLRSRHDWNEEPLPPALAEAQESIAWAEHLVMLFPLWLGTMPALLKGFLEQVLRPGFATAGLEGGKGWRKLLKGRSARIVVTMGMPALAYRLYFREHGVKNLMRNILHFVGIAPSRRTYIGMIEGMSDAKRGRWLAEMARLGERAR